ncbi:ribosome-associated protein [Algoriphagus ornithinivorans]|jgi:ribosome-associated protein|uniref:Ribosome-associated protein n=1 Tax=Algoriphagus ornithinivorans TaxID=226506 RepID=A0A1I5C1M7_9BACT|nr:alternative ribosome rescue aminoacyl-tRNA hydrolase ArfB [Algoriphagus ornithinivorans]SFN80724.1 ribosome-associated protein [Algoriphagus ornithinivorans]
MKSLEKRIAEGDFLKELDFQTARSSGPGGQNVNKVESKVQLYFDVQNSTVLSDEEKEKLSQKFKNKIDLEGKLQLQSQEKRSQIQNKELVVKKFYDLLRKAFEKRKIRKATKPTKAAVEKRIKEKKARSEKKAGRGWTKDY